MRVPHEVKGKEWQKVRESLLGQWKKRPTWCCAQLVKYMGSVRKAPINKLHIVMNYLTGTGFRTGKIKHKCISNIRKSISEELKRRKKSTTEANIMDDKGIELQDKYIGTLFGEEAEEAPVATGDFSAKLKDSLGEMTDVGSAVEPIHGKIIEFFRKNPNPSDEMVHQLASSIGMNPHEFERHIYMVLTKMVSKPVGKHQHLPDSKFDPAQLAMGAKVELEHTDCPIMAKEIAKDHLMECADYYSRLARMEDNCKRGVGGRQDYQTIGRHLP